MGEWVSDREHGCCMPLSGLNRTVNQSPPYNRGNGAPIDYYGAVVWPYPQPQPQLSSSGNGSNELSAGRVYFMLPMRFTHHLLPCNGPDGSQCLPATFDVPVLSSRDGVNFTYAADDRGSLVEPAAAGGWNSNGLTYVLGTPHLTERGDEIVLYFWGTNANHNGVLDPYVLSPYCSQRQYTKNHAILLHPGLLLSGSGAKDGKILSGIASVRMRLDGFVHIEPTEPNTPANMVTRPLIYQGTRLLINADAGGSGQVFVTIEPVPNVAEKASIPEVLSLRSEPFCGNAINATIAWVKNPLAMLEGRVVRLRFEIYRARLFSFQFVK